MNEFVDGLPYGLKEEVSMFIHENTYKNVYFLRQQSKSFITWICPHLKPYLNPENSYIFFEGDAVCNILFLMKGECGFVLPNHGNLKYIDIAHGQYFGVLDIVGSCMKEGELDFNNFVSHKPHLKRQFTIKS